MTRRRLPGILELFVKARPCPGALPRSPPGLCVCVPPSPLCRGDSPARDGGRDAVRPAGLGMLVGVPREQGDALRLPIRWQVSIKVTPITAASGLPLAGGCPGGRLGGGGVTSAPGAATAPGRGVSRQSGGAAPDALPLGDRHFVPFPTVLGAKVAFGTFRRRFVPRRAHRRLRHGAARRGGGICI